jgi:hypothetical protein
MEFFFYVKEVEMGRSCSNHGKEKNAYGILVETLKEGDH